MTCTAGPDRNGPDPQQRLAQSTTLVTEVIQHGGSSSATCPGTVTEPTATSGRLRVYVGQRQGTTTHVFPFASTRFGTGLLLVDDTAAGDSYASGTWAAQPAAATSARAVPGEAEVKK